jgi:hypothetical protein
MQYPIKIEGFEGHQLAVTSEEFFSSPKLLLDGQPAPKGKNRGEFILHNINGTDSTVQLTSAYMGFDPVPRLSVAGKSIQIMEPVDRFEWAWSGIPLILVIVGGVLGTLFGIVAFAFNVRVFRSQRSLLKKFLLTALISAVSAGLTYGVPVIAAPLIKLVFHTG